MSNIPPSRQGASPPKMLTQEDYDQVFRNIDPRFSAALDAVKMSIIQSMGARKPANFETYEQYRSYCVERVELLRIHELYRRTLAGALTERLRGVHRGR